MLLSEYLFVAILAFVAGSIPLSRLANINTIPNIKEKRRLGALAKVLIDLFKGCSVVAVAHAISGEYAVVATISVFLGHNFPVFAGVRGGNGLGTALGALIALDPMIGLTALSAWTFGYYVFQHAEVAALVSATVVPLAAGYFALPFSTLALWPIAIFIYWRNREKIAIAISAPKRKKIWQED